MQLDHLLSAYDIHHQNCSFLRRTPIKLARFSFPETCSSHDWYFQGMNDQVVYRGGGENWFPSTTATMALACCFRILKSQLRMALRIQCTPSRNRSGLHLDRMSTMSNSSNFFWSPIPIYLSTFTILPCVPEEWLIDISNYIFPIIVLSSILDYV
jgi:hypothetical protein